MILAVVAVVVVVSVVVVIVVLVAVLMVVEVVVLERKGDHPELAECGGEGQGNTTFGCTPALPTSYRSFLAPKNGQPNANRNVNSHVQKHFARIAPSATLTFSLLPFAFLPSSLLRLSWIRISLYVLSFTNVIGLITPIMICITTTLISCHFILIIILTSISRIAHNLTHVHIL
ncbi:hypothetical protein N9L68_04070 [bacterium]|nr:hypothetical protein [bacterium]